MNKKVILITGASSGMGMEAAIMLLQQGHTVYGAARRLDKLQELTKHGLIPMAMDVSDEESIKQGIDIILAKEGRVDVLINNAGYGSYGALEDTPMSEARYQMEVNVMGLARLTQLVLPSMREKRSGRIINISSIGGKIGEPHGAWYHASKFAVEGLSASLRMELAQFNIDVVVIRPGAINTEWNTIAHENLLKVSGSTAYGNLVHKHALFLAQAGVKGSHPRVVGRTIAKAATVSRPRTSYATGGGARMILIMRWLLSDRAFQSVMLSLIRRAKA